MNPTEPLIIRKAAKIKPILNEYIMNSIATVSLSNLSVFSAPKEEIIPYTKNKFQYIETQFKDLYKSSK